ncbi:hypothetical protein E4U52_000310 [Claviceps spartinae]|nr:hypothetical protein E4U52_000310 [Claviceps spartinae]
MAFPASVPPRHRRLYHVEARLRTVTFKEYILRALELSDGRLAQHPKFRYVAYNMWIRTQTHKRSTFYLKKDQREDITLEKLREMFNQDRRTLVHCQIIIRVFSFLGIAEWGQTFVGNMAYQLEISASKGTVFGVLV